MKLIFINGLLVSTGLGVEENFFDDNEETTQNLFIPDDLGIKVKQIDIVDLDFDSQHRQEWEGSYRAHGTGKLYPLKNTTFDS